jgi:rubredoxin
VRGPCAPVRGPLAPACARGRAVGAALSCAPMSEAQQWICESCGFIYDPEEGDPDGGVPAGTPFEEIPDDWFCPVCGARKRDFSPFEG